MEKLFVYMPCEGQWFLKGKCVKDKLKMCVIKVLGQPPYFMKKSIYLCSKPFM